MGRQLKSVPRIIKALGGPAAVQEITSASGAVVSNWKNTGFFPANTYVVLQDELRKNKLNAPDVLWKMRKAANRRAGKKRK